jgi:hypothetical protein
MDDGTCQTADFTAVKERTDNSPLYEVDKRDRGLSSHSRIDRTMSRKLRSRKVEEREIGQVLERAVKGMRNEMSTVLWKIKRSRDNSLKALKKMFRNGLEAMVGGVEKAMYGVNDGLTKEWKEKEPIDEAYKVRSDREYREKEERSRKEEERIKKLEKRLEREVRESKGRWRE